MADNNENIEKEELTYTGILKEIWSWVWSLGLAVIAVLLIKNFLFSTTFVRQQSMYPTLTDWDMLIINRLEHVRGVPLKRGDIVVFEAPIKAYGTVAQYPEETAMDSFWKLFKKTLYVKRVIGVAGDQVTIEKGVLYINGEAQEEAYVNPASSRTHGDVSVLVPEGYVFCLGDNRGNSWDCEEFGVVPLERVEGSANFRMFPFNKIGTID